MDPYSIVEWFGGGDGGSGGHKCGYCGCADGSWSDGVWAHLLTAKDYKALLDRGWRRSGCYVYRPVNERSCCPTYPIRVSARLFTPRRSQRKALSRFLSRHGVAKGGGCHGNPGKQASTAQSSSSSSLLEQQHQGGKSVGLFAYDLGLAFSHFSSRLVRASDLTGEEFAEEHSLYVKYQLAVHGDREADVGEAQFKRFLVRSPLKHCTAGYGSYHEQYRENEGSGGGGRGRLFAVGVVDILPGCVSSVYVFYDPDYRHLSPGKITALNELRRAQRMCRQPDDDCYYYMGFYIHGCPKMRYKAEYGPVQLLCPKTLRWVDMTTLDDRLKRCVALREEEGQKSGEAGGCDGNSQLQNGDSQQDCLLSSGELGKVLVLLDDGRATTLSRMRRVVPSDERRSISRYVSLVGMEMATRRLLLYREEGVS